MITGNILRLVLLLGLFAVTVVSVDGYLLNINTDPQSGNASSPTLYGLMFEDINHSGDGGIYAEMIRNRAFQSTPATLEAYSPVGTGVTINLDNTRQLNGALRTVLRVDVPQGATGRVGFSNAGYWGMYIAAGTAYQTQFEASGPYQGDFYVAVRSSDGETVFGTAQVKSACTSPSWANHEVVIVPDLNAPNVDNAFELTFDASAVAGNSIYFTYISLFPPTFANSVSLLCLGRPNGLRQDLSQVLLDIQGSFLRWPGGNNLEGNTLATRWKWNLTIGDPHDRPGRPGNVTLVFDHLFFRPNSPSIALTGTWSYTNTDGLGMMEYLTWTEDMRLENVMAVFAGYALDGECATGSTLAPYIQDALDQIEYAVGDQSTQYGRQRAQDGHPEPFSIKYVEIGNEDFFDKSNSYEERFHAMRSAILDQHPDMILISTSTSQFKNPLPAGTVIDVHHYETPSKFVSMFGAFDHFDRANPVMVGEYATWEGDDGKRLLKPTLQAAVSEAVFMLGMERNSDIVQFAAYAPLLQNANAYQWTPDMIEFTADPTETSLSPSYYVQKLLSTNRAGTILPTDADFDIDPLFWTASISRDSSSDYIVKFANPSGTTFNDVMTQLQGLPEGRKIAQGTVYTLTNAQGPNATEGVVPTATELPSGQVGGQNISVNIPPWSVVVTKVTVQ